MTDSKPSLRADWPVYLVLFAILALSATGMWPDLANSRVDLNDNVSHFAMIERIVQTVESGGNPVDTWSPEWTCGFPMLRVYQPLAHWIVAGLYFAMGKAVALMTVFVWVRFLAVVLLPVSFYVCARLFDFSRIAALAAAAMAPLISSSGLYGLEYGSYVWAGRGLFPQSVAAHLMLLSLGFGFRAVRFGIGQTVAGVLLGLTFLSHLIFGYMGAMSLVLLALLPDPKWPRRIRVMRTAHIGAAAAAISAFQLLPLLVDGPIINHSRWEPVWKWDGFGAAGTLKYLFTGGLLDANRLPVLSFAALAGAVLVVWRRPGHESHIAGRFTLAASAFWLLLLFGRPFWGPALLLAGVSPDMQLHRVAAGVQVFLVLLAAIGLAEFWRELADRRRTTVAAVCALLLLAPAIRERSQYLSNNERFGRENLAAYAASASAIDATIALLKERGGRVYTGIPAGWGGQHRIGSVPFFAFLSVRQVPAVAYLYHAMALTADVQVRMNEWNPAHYGLFGIRTVVAPAGIRTPLPPFWMRERIIGKFDIFRTPETGYFDVVDVPSAVHTTKQNFYAVNDRWLQSPWVENHMHLLLDLGGPAPKGLAFLPDSRLPMAPRLAPAGAVVRQDDQQAVVDVLHPAYVLFKMTWHANWRARVDGEPVATAMLSPGFIGVPVSPGRHTVELHYEGSRWKSWLAGLGVLAAGFLAWCETAGRRRGELALSFH